MEIVKGMASRPQPLPPMAWPPALRWLPHVLVVLGACALSLTGADAMASLLATAHAATLVVALRWPVPAWWLSTAFVIAIELFHPPTPDNEPWAWIVQAGVLFLVALRNRSRVTTALASLSGLLVVGLKLAGADIGSWQVVGFAVAAFAVAAFLGVAGRSRREAKARLAEQVALTAQERARRTVLEERARIARELHDVVAHHMSVISIQADAAPYRVHDPPPELVEAFAAIRRNALEGLTELRRLLGLLRTADDAVPDAPQPTLGQLDALLAGVRTAGLPVTADISGTARPLPPGVELAAFRIVQEALSNALRHAPGSTAHIEISYEDTAVRLSVHNTAPAHPAKPTPGTGHGVLGMRERAAMLGGDLTAGPAPAGGYHVTALLPTNRREGRP
jgi:signal transduction histidine kinase